MSAEAPTPSSGPARPHRGRWTRKKTRQLKWIQYSGIGTVWALFVASAIVGSVVGQIPWWTTATLGLVSTFMLERVTRAVMVQTDPMKVPVLMYHSVAPDFDLIPAPGLSVRPEVFAAQLQLFRDEGYSTHTLSELRTHLTGEMPLQGKPLVITFDDGYLDNFVFAFPLLKQFGAKATIFISADFVDQAKTPRRKVRTPGDRSEEGGGAYLSWSEIREMVDSSLVEIESHAASHDLLPRSDRVVDYHRPGIRNPWLAWRLFPGEKPRWFMRRAHELGFGRAIYETGPALDGPCFLPDPGLDSRLIEYVARRGAGAFFRRRNWREELDRITGEYRAEQQGCVGRMETDDEWRERVREELIGSRVRLSRGLGREVSFLAWPHDRFNDQVAEIALDEAGYVATSAGLHHNEPGADASGFSRIPAGEAMLGRPWTRGDLWLLRANLALFRGNYLYYLPAFVASRVRDLVLRIAPPR